MELYHGGKVPVEQPRIIIPTDYRTTSRRDKTVVGKPRSVIPGLERLNGIRLNR
jgi:hypothetical protein